MSPPILVTGAEGMLGSAVVKAAKVAQVDVVGLTKRDLDITDEIAVYGVLDRYPDDGVINCAGIVRERQDVHELEMSAVNGLGPHLLARSARRLLQISTDCVFDGKSDKRDYFEDSLPTPIDFYGRTKLKGEVTQPPHLTVRMSFVGLGPRGLLHWLLNQPPGAEVPGYTNWIWNGWTVNALAPYLVALAMRAEPVGLLHLPGPTIMTKDRLLRMVASLLRPGIHVVPVEAPEPRRMVLGSNLRTLSAYNGTWEAMVNDLFAQMHGSSKGRL